MGCIRFFYKDTSLDIVSLERDNVVECVCHDQGEAEKGFFYMYMRHFSQLHMRIPFNDFTMGVLQLLNVAPTQYIPIVGDTCKRSGCYADHYTCIFLLNAFCTFMIRV